MCLEPNIAEKMLKDVTEPPNEEAPEHASAATLEFYGEPMIIIVYYVY